MSIVLELQKEAMKSDKDILTILRMALAVATKLDLNDFEVWIGKELEGYQEEDIIPNYRQQYWKIESSDKSDNSNDFFFSLVNKFKRLTNYSVFNSIPDLIQIMNTNECNLVPKLTSSIVHNITKEAKIDVCVQGVDPNIYIPNIIEQVRTEIFKWALLLEKNDILGNEATFTKEEKEIAKTNQQIIQYITNNNIYGDNNNTQVQQNSDNSKQTIKQEFDYESVLKLLLSIQNQSDDQKFITAFGDKTEEIKSIINETIEMVKQKDEPTKIKTCLNKLKDITQNVAGNLLATGIYNEILQLMKSLTSG